MKKTIFLALSIALMAGMTSCKKDYRCCIHIIDTATATSTESCEDRDGLSRKDLEAIEDTGYYCTEK